MYIENVCQVDRADIGNKSVYVVWTPGGTIYMPKSYLDPMSDTNKARDLIFGKDAPWGLENTVPQSGHQVALQPQVVPPIYQKLVLTLSQRLSKVETSYLSQVFLGA